MISRRIRVTRKNVRNIIAAILHGIDCCNNSSNYKWLEETAQNITEWQSYERACTLHDRELKELEVIMNKLLVYSSMAIQMFKSN